MKEDSDEAGESDQEESEVQKKAEVVKASKK